MKLTIKIRLTGIPTQQAMETGAPSLGLTLQSIIVIWTNTSVYGRWNLLLKVDKLGFQPFKEGRQGLSGLLIQSMRDETYFLKKSFTGIPMQQAR